jgi:hypothetical protein
MEKKNFALCFIIGRKVAWRSRHNGFRCFDAPQLGKSEREPANQGGAHLGPLFLLNPVAGPHDLFG